MRNKFPASQLHSRRFSSGMTLIRLLTVLAIIGLVGSWIFSQLAP
jgi:type II secretory pathway pseudopilin PulG